MARLSTVVYVAPISTGQARTAWQIGVVPMLEAFPNHAGDILRAIAFAHEPHSPCRCSLPVLAHLIAEDGLRAPLDVLSGWLGKENAVIMTILLLVIGAVVIAEGIGSFERGPPRVAVVGYSDGE